MAIWNWMEREKKKKTPEKNAPVSDQLNGKKNNNHTPKKCWDSSGRSYKCTQIVLILMKMLTILIVFLVCVFFLFRFHVFPCCFYTFCSRFLPSAISSCWTLEINFVWTFSAQLFIRLDLILSFYLIESHEKAAHAEEVAHVWVFNGAITAI